MKLLWALPILLALQEPTVESLYESAEQARKENKPAAALKDFKAALAKKPDHIPSHLGYQKLLQFQGKEPALLAEYEALHKKHNAPWTFLLYGRLLHDAAKEEELYLKGLAMDPGHVDLKKALIDVYQSLRQFDKAIPLQRELAKVGTASVSEHLYLIQLMFDGGRLEEMLKEYPGGEDAVACLTRGAALFLIHRESDGLPLIEKAARMKPGELRYQESLATAYAKSNRYETALKILAEVGDAHPYDVRTLRRRGLLLAMTKRDPESVRFLKTAVRLEPGESSLHADLAAAYSLVGEPASAESSLREALRLDPLNDVALHRMALLSFNRADHAGCVEWILKAISVHRDEAAYHQLLAGAYERLGKAELARASREMAAKLKSQFDFTVEGYATEERILTAKELECRRQINFAHQLLNEGKTAEAKARYAEALQSVPDDPFAIYALGRLAHRSGDWEVALKRYEQLKGIPRSSMGARVALRIADCLYDMGRTQEAAAAYRAAHKSWGNRLSSFERPGELAEALAKAPPDARRLRIPGMKIGDSVEANYCFPLALDCILRRWKLPSDVAATGRALVKERGPTTFEIVDFLAKRDDVKLSMFLATPGVMRGLVEAGLPVMLFREIPARDYRSGHVGVVTGYDDARQVFLLEDSQWYGGADYVPYAVAEGAWCAIVAPPADLGRVEALLPGRDYCALMIEAYRASFSNDLDKAERLLKKALLIRPGGSEPLRALGEILLARKDPKAALEWFQKAADAPDAGAVSFGYLGRMQMNVEKYEPAARSFESALRLEPDSIVALVDLGHARLRLDKAAEAVSPLQRAVDLDDEILHARYFLGNALLQTGQHAKAIPHLSYAARFPETYHANRWLASCFAATGRKDRAITALKKYLEFEKNPEDRAKAEAAIKELMD